MRKDIKVPVDGKKLTYEIHARQLTKVEAGKRIGYSHSYLANCGSFGQISQRAVKLLETVLGIRYEDIRPDEQQDRNLIELSKVRIHDEKIEFFENCEEKISNAVVTLNVCLDMIDQLQSIREQVENDLKELVTVQDVYQKTLSRIKESA